MKQGRQQAKKHFQGIRRLFSRRARQSAEERDGGEGGGVTTLDPWSLYGQSDNLAGLDDDHLRFKVETANEQALREQFKQIVEQTKNPEEKARLRNLLGQQNQLGRGLRAHPILAKFKQFFNREINLLPTMDVEQQVKHQELQLQKQYLHDLQKRNEQEMSPSR